VSEFLDLAALTGPAFAQTVGFLYGRLANVLDRRRQSQTEVIATPAVLEGELGPLVISEPVVEHHRAELEGLLERIGVAQANLRSVNRRDDGLATDLERLRDLLEQIYGQHITLSGEDRPSSGVRVDQRARTVRGQMVGLDADEATTNARVDVTQNIGEVSSSGSVIGARIKKLG